MVNGASDRHVVAATGLAGWGPACSVVSVPLWRHPVFLPAVTARGTRFCATWVETSEYKIIPRALHLYIKLF